MAAGFSTLDDLEAREFWANLRLRWTCHSNAIEGNSLTYRDTSLLLLLGATEGRHLIREYDEIRGHDAAIETVRVWGNRRHRPTPDDLRHLHELLLVRPHRKMSPDGEHQYWIVPGQYKQDPNFAPLPGGGHRVFAAPYRVPELMQAFCRHLHAHLDFMQAHPTTRDVAMTLVQIHRELILIHPFADGNGRLTRLEVNYVAMMMGYSPLIIELDERQTYIDAVERANEGDGQPLRVFFARALDFALAVAAGQAAPSWHNEHGDPHRPPEPSQGDAAPAFRCVLNPERGEGTLVCGQPARQGDYIRTHTVQCR